MMILRRRGQAQRTQGAAAAGGARHAMRVPLMDPAGMLASRPELGFGVGTDREFQEPAGRGRQGPGPVGEDDAAGDGRAWVAHDGAEPGGYLGEGLREERGACAGQHERQDGLPLCGHDRDVRGQPCICERLVEQPPAGCSMRCGDERYAAKFCDGELGWPYGARRQDDQQPLPGEFMRGESGGE